MLKYVLLIIFGAVSGVLGGMGMGGGTLLIPLLTLFSGMEQHTAQLYNLIGFVPMAAVALVIHSKNGLVKKSGLLPMALSAAVTSVGAGFIAAAVAGPVLKRIFGGFLLIVAVYMLVGSLFPKKRKI